MEWLRYEMEGLNHWRIDEKHDADDPADGIDADDPFRIQRYYVNGPGQLGQIVKAVVYDYSGEEPVTTDYYYGYDVLGNVSVISGNAGIYDGLEIDQFEQDAFGNQVEGSWSGGLGDTITERLTTKQFDADLGPNGLYYFNARWYDPVVGAFLSRDVVKNYGSQYIYCYSNPIQYVDPTGNDPCDFGALLDAGRCCAEYCKKTKKSPSGRAYCISRCNCRASLYRDASHICAFWLDEKPKPNIFEYNRCLRTNTKKNGIEECGCNALPAGCNGVQVVGVPPPVAGPPKGGRPAGCTQPYYKCKRNTSHPECGGVGIDDDDLLPPPMSRGEAAKVACTNCCESVYHVSRDAADNPCVKACSLTFVGIKP